MGLSFWIQFIIGIPFVGFVVSLLVPERKEYLLSWVAFFTAGLNMFSVFVFLIFWGIQGFETLNLREISLYKTDDFVFLINFFFDRVGAVYVLIGALLTFLITFIICIVRADTSDSSILFCSSIWDSTSRYWQETSRRFSWVGRYWGSLRFFWWLSTGKITFLQEMPSKSFRSIESVMWELFWPCGLVITYGMKILLS